MLSSKYENTDNSKLNTRAQPTDFTWKPLTRLSASNIIMALITNKNRPSVRMVTGRVTRISNGFIKKFNTDSTNATTSAVRKRSMLTPVCNTYDESIMAAAVINVFTIKFFIYRENCRG